MMETFHLISCKNGKVFYASVSILEILTVYTGLVFFDDVLLIASLIAKQALH